MRKHLILSQFFALTAMLAAPPVMAQERAKTVSFGGVLLDEEGEPQGHIDGIRKLPDAEITVTATGIELELEHSGQSVTVIAREEIGSVQGADLTRILRRAPGVSLSRNGGTGAFTGLRVRGAEAEQLLVLIDRVKVNDPSAPGGGFDFGNLLAGNVEVLDLTRSANSTIWGADALGGVLDVTTRRVTGLSANAEYGADDTALLSAAGGLGDSDEYIGAAGSYFTSDGFSAAANGAEPDGFEQWAISAKGNVRVTYGLDAFANARYAKGDLDIDGFPFPAFTLADTHETQETAQYSGAAGLTYNDRALNLTTRYSLTDTQRENFDPQLSPDPTFASDGHSDRLDLRGQWRFDDAWAVKFGGEYEWLSYETNFDARQETQIAGAYAQIGIEDDDLSAHLGVRHDDHKRFGSATSFGADVSYEIVPDLRLRASMGEGFKAPSLFQLFSDFGNDTLRPERAISYDLGLSYGIRGKPIHAALTFFRRDSSDLIEFVSCFGSNDAICTDRPFGTYDNVAKARSQGFEVELGLSPEENFRVQAAYSYLDAQNRTAGAANEGKRLARRPDHMLTLSADWTIPASGAFEGLTLGGDIRLAGDSFDDADNFTSLDAYALADVRASLPMGENFEVYGRIENIWGEDYQTAAGYATRGWAGFVGARIVM